MTFIVTGEADQLNRLKDDLVSNGYTQSSEYNNADDFIEIWVIEKEFDFWPMMVLKKNEFNRLIELTPDNYDEIINKILQQ